MSTSEITVVPGTPSEWREFDNEDYDPKAEEGGDDDALGKLIAERTDEEPFGIVVVADPIEIVSDGLIKRLAAALIPTHVRRESRAEGKPGEEKKAKKKEKKEEKKD